MPYKTTQWAEMDASSVRTPRRGSKTIWQLDYDSDAEAVKAFMEQALISSRHTDDSMDMFDHQFSQFVRRYFLRKHGISLKELIDGRD